MSSKDKLIEFLKSANISHWEYIDNILDIVVETELVTYIFNKDGSYFGQY